jgi:predicted small secreted protein
MKQNLIITLTLFLCVALAACSNGGSGTDANKTPGYDFIDNFATGTISPAEEPSTPTGKPVLIIRDFAVGGEKRQAMITLASAKIVFESPAMAKDARLKFGIGMNTEVGDGAEGNITVEVDGTSEVVYRKFLDPVKRTEDRKWFDESVDLSKYAGKNIHIIFETKPGAKDDAVGDWVAWSQPILTR